MAGVPINFAVPGEGAVASYSYIDVVNNFGIITFYAMTTQEASLTYRLSTTAFPSHSLALCTGSANGFSANLPIVFEADAFNSPKTIYGGKAKALIPVEYYVYFAGGGGGNVTFTCEYKLYKKTPASVETLIGSSKGSSTLYRSGTSRTQVYWSISMDLSQTSFAIGDKLVLKITEISGMSTGSSSFLGHDPSNRKGGYENEKQLDCLFKLEVPFRLNL